MLYRLIDLFGKDLPLSEASTFERLNAVLLLSVILLAVAIMLILIYAVLPPNKKGPGLPPIAKYILIEFLLVSILSVTMILQLPDKDTGKEDAASIESYTDE